MDSKLAAYNAFYAENDKLLISQSKVGIIPFFKFILPFVLLIIYVKPFFQEIIIQSVIFSCRLKEKGVDSLFHDILSIVKKLQFYITAKCKRIILYSFMVDVHICIHACSRLTVL